MFFININEINVLNKKNKLLRMLSQGCRIHPAYRAHRKATERCKECVVAWNARLELNAPEDS